MAKIVFPSKVLKRQSRMCNVYPLKTSPCFVMSNSKLYRIHQIFLPNRLWQSLLTQTHSEMIDVDFHLNPLQSQYIMFFKIYLYHEMGEQIKI